MATGLGTKLVGQVGEHLVCAELGRRGLVAAPFAGNVPGYDLVATDKSYTAVPIQVKTCNGTSWQFSLDTLLVIGFDPETGRQRIAGLRKMPNPDLVFVYVWLGHTKKKQDRFFVLTLVELQHITRDHHQAFLERHDGVRPKNPASLHCALSLRHFEPFEDRWDLIREQLEARRRGPSS